MFAYCNNNPVLFVDSIGSHPVRQIESVNTELIGEDLEGNAQYKTTIIVHVDYVREDYPIVTGYDVFSFVFNVNKNGMVTVDNSQEGQFGMVDSTYGRLFAQEIITTANQQVEGALEGRTVDGIYRELTMHYTFFKIGLFTTSTDISHIGSTNPLNKGFDENARYFEDPWKNLDIPANRIKGAITDAIHRFF